MKIRNYTAALLLGAGIIAGCSGMMGGDQSKSTGKATVAGKVADGYLVNALVFLDKNHNYQLDAGEPSVKTGADGSYSLAIDPADAGKYPIVALAVAGESYDLDDNPNLNLSDPGSIVYVPKTYVLSMHAVSVTADASGTATGSVNNFISPISTLIRETLEATPGMTVNEAITQIRNQLNLPTDLKIQGDYVFGSMSGAKKDDYKRMHDTARAMAGLMGEQADMVMNPPPVERGGGKPEMIACEPYGSALIAPEVNRYKQMMGQIGNSLPQISVGEKELIREKLNTMLQTIPKAQPFRNISSLFGNFTGHQCFWKMSSSAKGEMMRPKQRGRR